MEKEEKSKEVKKKEEEKSKGENKEGKEEKENKKSQIGGVLDETDEIFDSICPICLDETCTHVHSVCGAAFCGGCIAAIVQQPEEFRNCPTCRKQIKSAVDILEILRSETKKKRKTKSMSACEKEEKLIQDEIDVWETTKDSKKIDVIVETPEHKRFHIKIFDDMPISWVAAAISKVAGTDWRKIDFTIDDVVVNLSADGGGKIMSEYDFWDDSVISYKPKTDTDRVLTGNLQEEIDKLSKSGTKIFIFLKNLNGIKYKVNLCAEINVHALKVVIAHVNDICVEQVRLILRGHPMYDEFELSHFGLKEGDTIHCIMQMRGS